MKNMILNFGSSKKYYIEYQNQMPYSQNVIIL